MKRAAPIVGVRLRNTSDPRTGVAAGAWTKLEQKLAAARATIPRPVDFYFGVPASRPDTAA